MFHHAKWDLAEFHKEGVEWPDFEDTILKAHLLGHHPLGLKALMPIFTGVEQAAFKDVVGTGKKAVLMDTIASRVWDYCSLDAWGAFKLNERFTMPPRLQPLYEQEKQITRILMDMEAAGLPLDQDKLRTGRRLVLKRMAQLEEQLRSVGIEELTKATAIGQRFWKGKPKKVTTKSGELSTAAAVLLANATVEQQPWVQAFIEWRQLSHFEGTYLAAWKGQDTLHPSLNQTGTMTWRFSSSDPNLQNIPKSKLVSLYNLFVAPEGQVFVSADYSQLQLRILANLTGDATMRGAYHSGRDLHQETHDILTQTGLFTRLGIDHHDQQRTIAKNTNFGIAFGQTAYGLAPRIQVTQDEAQEFIDAFYAAYPTAKPWQQAQISFAEEHGYVETFKGRPLYVPCILAERGKLRYHGEKQAMCDPIQGGEAEIVKDGMLRASQYLRFQVHDELLYLVPENEAKEYAHFLDETLTDRRHDVPYTVKVSTGKTWGAIKSLDDLWDETLDTDPEE